MQANQPEGSMRQILSKEPWWATPPEPGQDELKLEWGWLVHYSEGEPRFEFVRERPSDDEIRNRKSCPITPAAGGSGGSDQAFTIISKPPKIILLPSNG